MPAWLQYTLIRLGVFAIALTALLLLQVHWLLAAIIAAVIGFCVGYIFFRDLRIRMATELAAARARSPRGDDEDAEDAAAR